MPKQRSWTDEQLRIAVAGSKSFRNVIILLNLVPAGGNYEQVKSRTKELGYSTEHFLGKAWNKGIRYELDNKKPLSDVLVNGSSIQSYKLKHRLYNSGLKTPKCEMCGWCTESLDGRIPVELDHINGNKNDNRLLNLRILCPNCHSLQTTHRGKNKKVSLKYN